MEGLYIENATGMVCSMAHPDMPGDLGEFRVSSWDFLGPQGYGKPETRRLHYGDYGPIAIAPTSTTSG